MPFLEDDQLPNDKTINLANRIDIPKAFAVTPGANDLEDNGTKQAWNWGAAFRRNNELAAVAASESAWIGNEPEPGFNPWDKIKGTPDEANFAPLSEARNQKKFDAIQADIARENADRKRLDSQPWWMGLITEGTAGVLSPTSLIPGGTFVKGARGGIALAKAGASAGVANAVSAGAQEAALHGIEQTRTAGESATAVGASLLLGGLLGAGGQALLSKGEWFRATRDLDRELHLGGPVHGTPVTADLLSGDVSGEILARHYPGFEAYHGSPHNFDKFDSTKIGDGEGSQAQGHGLYFAERRDVAEQYRDNLSRAIPTVNGRIQATGDGKFNIVDDFGVQAGPFPNKEQAELSLRGTEGNLYRVKINADQERFLDWDKSFSEQSEFVRKALSEHADPEVAGTAEKHGAVSGRAFYERLRSRRTSQAEVSTLLNDSGIHGVKYLDAGSRDAGDGSRNFVVFDDKLIQILDKNGTPVDVSLGGSVAHSVGAASSSDGISLHDLSVAGKIAGAVARATSGLNPALRLIHSDSINARLAFVKGWEFTPYLNMNMEGRTLGASAETRSLTWDGGLITSIKAQKPEWLEYRKAGGDLSYDEFLEEAGKAARRSDSSGNQYIDAVAKEHRKSAIDPLTKDAVAVGLLKPEDLAVTTAPSYFHRMWLTGKLIANEPVFKSRVVQWVKDNLPEWADQFDKGVERRLNPVRQEISDQEMAKLRRAEELKQRADAADTSEMSEGDIRQALRIVNGGAPKPKGVDTLSQFVLKAGGLVDDAGELAHRGITNKARPGLVRKERRTAQSGNKGGWTLDDMARHAWENGYFPENSQRPSIDAFVEALNDDFHKTRAVLKNGDEEAYRLTELVSQLEADLARAGVATDGKAPRFSTSEEMKGAVERVYKALDAEADRKITVLKDKLRERETDARVDRESRFLDNPDELGKQVADDVFNSLTGRSLNGLSNNFFKITAKGPLQGRTFNAPDALFEDFLENNIETVSRHFVKTVAPQVEFQRAFGSLDMADQVGKIRDDYATLRAAAKTERERLSLDKQEKQDVKDLKDLLDLKLGQGPGAAGDTNYGRIVRAVNNFNYLRSMGEVSLASIPETIMPAVRHGLLPYMETLGQTLSNLNGIKISAREAQLAGNVSDRVLPHQVSLMAEISDPTAARSKIEAFLDSATNVASKWNGIRLLTDMQKTIASVMTQNRVLENAARYTEIPQGERAYMAFLKLDQSMSERIAAQFAEHGETIDKVRVANTERWTDDVARNAYRSAINLDVNSTILTRSVADVPTWANTNTGKILGQFKGFALASHQRILLRGLQEDHARFLGSVVALTAMGMAVTWIKAVSGNREEKLQDFSKNPGWWISEGFDRAGITAILTEVSNIAEKATGFNPVKTPMKIFDESGSISQKNQNRNFLGAVAGPTGNLVGDAGVIANIPSKLVKGEDVTQGDKGAIERTIPFNSYLGVRQFIRYIANPPQQ